MVKSLSVAEQEEMRQKVRALTFFKSNKPWDCARRYTADYVDVEQNPTRVKYRDGMAKIFATYGDTEVLFSDTVNKVNRKGKSQKRVIVVTDRSLYKQNPSNYKIRKSEVPLSQINGLR